MNRFEFKKDPFGTEVSQELSASIRVAIEMASQGREVPGLFGGFDINELSADDIEMARRVLNGEISRQTDEDFVNWRRKMGETEVKVNGSRRSSAEILADALGSHIARISGDLKAA